MYIYNKYIYIYPQARVSPCPGLISVAQINEQRTTDVTREPKAPGPELSQNNIYIYIYIVYIYIYIIVNKI